MTLVEEREEPGAEAAFELEVAFPLRGQRARKRGPRDIALAHHDLSEWEVVRLLVPESRIELEVREEALIHEQFAETPHVIPQSPQLTRNRADHPQRLDTAHAECHRPSRGAIPREREAGTCRSISLVRGGSVPPDRGRTLALVKRGAFAVLVLALLAAGCGSTKTVTNTVTVTTAKTGVGPPAEISFFGHIRSLKPQGSVYRLRFDPEWFLSGLTANVAAAQDGAVEPGQPVPNDNYRVDESHRVLTFRVPTNAHVTVITKAPTGTPISVAQLAQIVDGTSKLKLFEPLESGVWIVVHVDTVRSLDQQYQP